MKPFEDYSPKSRFFWGREVELYKQQLVNEINEAKMSAYERELALAEVPMRVSAYGTKKNKKFKEERARLTAEFWKDARAELGYDQMLTEEGCKSLEVDAFNRGHAHGFSEIFYELECLVELLEAIVPHVKRKQRKT